MPLIEKCTKDKTMQEYFSNFHKAQSNYSRRMAINTILNYKFCKLLNEIQNIFRPCVEDPAERHDLKSRLYLFFPPKIKRI